jgi:hypothetical protein
MHVAAIRNLFDIGRLSGDSCRRIAGAAARIGGRDRSIDAGR